MRVFILTCVIFMLLIGLIRLAILLELYPFRACLRDTFHWVYVGLFINRDSRKFLLSLCYRTHGMLIGLTVDGVD